MNEVVKTDNLLFGSELSSNSLEACLTRAGIAKTQGCSAMRFDLSKVRYIYIDALLFILCTLSDLKRQGMAVELVLPEKDGRWDFEDAEDTSDEAKVRKARDFLKRWRFDDALLEAVGDLSRILPYHQTDYFFEPQKYYREGVWRDEAGRDTPLLSTLLIEISHMTRGPVGDKRVDEQLIEEFINDRALERRFRKAIAKAVGRDSQYFGKEFASTILKEALINTYEHPTATMAMIAMARDRPGFLTVAVADNGELIPSTIRQEFDCSEAKDEILDTIVVTDRDRQLLRRTVGDDDVEKYVDEYKRHVAGTVFATYRGTSSKRGVERSRRGQGLYYVKERTLEFGGVCTFRSGSAIVSFSNGNAEFPAEYHAVSPWRGNLVTIVLPTSST